MDIKNGIKKLLNDEYNIYSRIQSNPQFLSTPNGHCDAEKWINDVDIFNQKFLKEQPLYQRIKTIIFNRNSDTIVDLVACLKSILSNIESEESNDMKSYEIFLSQVISSVDQTSNYPSVFQYEMKDGERMIIKKLENLGLIENVVFMGMNFVGFDVTYDGLHYFDIKQVQNNAHFDQHMQYSQYDVFISHASTDKLEYVEQLKNSLDKLNINIFYDKDSLKWGDRWKQRILEGVASSEFAIIVISENFFGREWTEKELNELLNRQNGSGQKIILPLLHNITVGQLENKYPEVADIQAINTKDYTINDITYLFAEQLIKRLKEQRG